MKRLRIGVNLLAGVVLALTGCGGKGHQTTTLSPAAFSPTQSSQTTQPAKTDQPAKTPKVAADALSAQPATAAVAANPPVSSDVVPASQPPTMTALPASRAAKSGSMGTFMYVGTVVAEANGQPIYADKVLAKIDVELSKKTDLPAQQFRQVAQTRITDEVQLQIREELEFAAAQRSGSDEDSQVASSITAQWRQREINKAGGSLAVARRRSLDEDRIEFDEKVKDQYRRNLILLYYQQKVWPHVQVSAEDLRRYYDRNLTTLFSENSAVRFRVIKIAYRDTSDRARALSKAQGVHERAKRGEDFAVLAQEMNDNRAWARNKGYMDLVDEKDAEGQTRKVGGWLAKEAKGTLKQESLEKAIFALEAGQITEIIDDNDGFYIAKLEEKKVGRVKAFEEIEVQDAIRNKLERDQRTQLRRKEQEKLLKAAVWRINDKNMETAVDMAMQKYAIWARADNK